MMPSLTRLSVSYDPNFFKASDVVSISQLSENLRSNRRPKLVYEAAQEPANDIQAPSFKVVPTHVILSHIPRETIHHDFLALLPETGSARPRTATSTIASTAAIPRRPIPFAIAISIALPPSTGGRSRPSTGVVIMISTSVVRSGISVPGILAPAVCRPSCR